MIRTEDRGAVRWLILDNPARKNAVPRDGWAALADALEEAATAGPRAVVITGAGDDFCSGADLGTDDGGMADLTDRTAAEHLTGMRVVNRAAVALHRLPIPTLAAVDGVAVGAGMNLAIGCDVVLATPRARFSQVFVRRGLTMDFGGTWLLPRLVGLAAARDLALTGRVVDGEEAHRLGLVGRVVDAADLEHEATTTAEELAAGAPLAQRMIKTGLSRTWAMSFEETIAYEAQAQAVALGSEDVREGIAAFRERRAPEFRGR